MATVNIYLVARRKRKKIRGKEIIFGKLVALLTNHKILGPLNFCHLHTTVTMSPLPFYLSELAASLTSMTARSLLTTLPKTGLPSGVCTVVRLAGSSCSHASAQLL